MTPRAVLFDFDFTLGDSSDGIVECTNAALEALGLSPAAPDAIRRTIGLPLERMFEILTGSEEPAPPEFRRYFVARADQVMVDRTTLYPGVHETLADLAGRGARLGIVTTKYAYRVHSILAREGLDSAFAVVVGADAVRRPKPDPEGLRHALKTVGASAGDALFVGDSTTDAAAAQNASVPFVGVLSGVTPVAAFADYPAVAMLSGVSDLPGWLDGNGTGGRRLEETTTGE